MKRILVINPGSTSTKIAVYDNTSAVMEKTIIHTKENLARFDNVNDQLQMRKDLVVKALDENNIPMETITAVAARGRFASSATGGGVSGQRGYGLAVDLCTSE